MSSRKRPRLTDTEDLVHLYLHEAGQFELLSKDDEVCLAPRTAAADTRPRLHQVRIELEARLGRRASIKEIADELGISPAKVSETLQIAAEPLSLSWPMSEDGDTEFGDLVADRSVASPFEAAAAAMLPGGAAKVLVKLDERQRLVLGLRFLLDRCEPRVLV